MKTYEEMFWEEVAKEREEEALIQECFEIMEEEEMS